MPGNKSEYEPMPLIERAITLVAPEVSIEEIIQARIIGEPVHVIVALPLAVIDGVRPGVGSPIQQIVGKFATELCRQSVVPALAAVLDLEDALIARVHSI